MKPNVPRMVVDGAVMRYMSDDEICIGSTQVSSAERGRSGRGGNFSGRLTKTRSQSRVRVVDFVSCTVHRPTLLSKGSTIRCPFFPACPFYTTLARYKYDRIDASAGTVIMMILRSQALTHTIPLRHTEAACRAALAFPRLFTTARPLHLC